MEDKIIKHEDGRLLLIKKDTNYSVESFYHHDMFMEDLYFHEIEGEMYLVDMNKALVYDLYPTYATDILVELEKQLEDRDGELELYPLAESEYLIGKLYDEN